MLEKLVAWILNSYLGDYLDLNTDRLSVGILSGQVELENIPLKQDAFQKFDLPLQVKSGYVGKIRLSIPVSGLSSQPWVIDISDVYIVIEPKANEKYDEAAQEKMGRANKKKMLQDLEDNWKIERNPEEISSTYYTSWMSYGAGVATNILENLQLNLANLHIHYESEADKSSSSFSFGLIIEKLAAQSTDQHWKPQYVNSSSTNILAHKLVELVGMSLYWDNNTQNVSSAYDLPSSEVKRGEEKAMPPHKYLLEPVSGRALVKKNTSTQPLRSQNEPRLNVELRFEQFSLALDDLQYGGISSLLREFDLHVKRKPYLQTRPNVPVHNNARLWWHHAIDSNLRNVKDRNTRAQRDFILQRARDCVQYTHIYFSYLAGDKLTHHQNRAKHRIESDMDFDTLKVLRQIAVARVKSAGKWYQQTVVPSKPSSGGGYLSGWVSWYTGSKPSESISTTGASSLLSADSGYPLTDQHDMLSSASSSSLASSVNSQTTQATRGSSDSNLGLKLTSTERAKLEEELRDWVGSGEPTEQRSTLNKDHVFLHLNFVLQQVNFRLKQQNADGTSQGIVQLECHTIQSSATIKPRTRSSKFTLGLGGLYVKDLSNSNTQFPLLISPRQMEAASRSFGGGIGNLLSKNSSSPSSKDSAEIFTLEIEKNPVHSSKDIKIKMKTEPLDIIYNEGVVKQVQQFFSPRRRTQAMSKELSEFHLAERARRRYEQLKNKTKIDIQDTWENLLNTSTAKQSKRVGLRLDISAPQLIIPRDLSDSRTYMVVFDLGRLKVANLKDNQNLDDDDSMDDIRSLEDHQPMGAGNDGMEEDDFVTPMSTPPELDSDSVGQSEDMPSISVSEQELSGDNLYTHMYDRYEVLLADIQVLIVNRKDNWRLLTNKGFSHLHIIDKLSVNVLFERRLLLTADPQWPAIKLSAIMESLSIHVSELKLSQLNHCLTKLMSRGGGVAVSGQSPPVTPRQSDTNLTADRSKPVQLAHSESRFFAPLETRRVLDNSRVVTCGLDIHQMSLDINNKERCLVELQVAGVKADFTQLPSQSDLSLTVHSLIVADALQSYGPDFELLVASHRNVGLDSKSGSMCSSAIASPTSPKSPTSPRSPPRSPDPRSPDPRSPDPEYAHPQARKQTSYTSFQNAVISGIQKLLPVATATPMADHTLSSMRPPSLSASDHRPLSPVFVGEPLIKIEFTQAKAETAEDPTTKNLDVVFNTLDLVANQETIVELLAFFNEVMPKAESSRAEPSSSSESLPDTAKKPASSRTSELLTVQAEFRKLNILLHCPIHSQSTHVLRTPGDHPPPGHIIVNKVAMISMMGARIEASVGGSQSSVEAELGGLQVTDLSSDSVHSHVFAFGSMTADQISNMDQTIPAHMYQTCIGDISDIVERKAFNLVYNKADGISITSDSVSLTIGSIQYIHVPRFLTDLAQSVSLFQDYIEKAKQKLRKAANKVAENYVYKKRPQIEPMILCDVDITLDAPLLVLPCNNNSTEVLVAELGKMTVTNKQDMEWCNDMPTTALDIIDIQIRNMKLVTKEVDPQKTSEFGQEVILEEAGVDLVVAYKQQAEGIDDIEDSKESVDFDLELSQQEDATERNMDGAKIQRSVSLTAVVPHALEVSLTRQANELINQAITTANESTSSSSNEQISQNEQSSLADSVRTGDASNTSPMRKTEDDDVLHITADVSLPIVSLCIKDQLGGPDKQGIIEVTLEEISVLLQKTNPYITTVRLELTSLSVLDLLQPENSKNRYLALSIDKSHRKDIPRFISTSLPGSPLKTRKRKFCDDVHPSSSLPSAITDDNISHRLRALRNRIPVTPPSSPSEANNIGGISMDTDVRNLVTIELTMVDKNSPQFASVHNHINTNVNIDFNSLELVVNQETWVMVLDFFGMGAKVFTQEQQKEANITLKTQPPPSEGVKASLSVNSFSVVLVKNCYDLAKANINGFSAEVTKQQNTTRVSGVLGSVCLDDLSPHGCLHSCKFTTLSDESQHPQGESGAQSSALKFDVFKHDIPDQQLERDFDISVDLDMTSVIYTHTKRFPIEIINFLQDILENHDNIGHMRAASQGQQVPTGPGHAPRVLMNIRAGTPIIILPGSSLSDDVIVMHLGNLSISNKFLYAGDVGTLDHKSGSSQQVPLSSEDPMTQSIYTPQQDDPMTSSVYGGPDITLEAITEQNEGACDPPTTCLLDVMSLRLTEMDLYSARRVPDSRVRAAASIDGGDIKFKEYHLKMDKNRPLKDRCVLDLVVERNLDNDLSHSSPEIAICGELSTVHCQIDVEQYKLVRAMLDQNLGEELNDLQRVAKQLPQIQTILGGEVWTVLDMAIDLRNVTIELLHEHKVSMEPAVSLARLDFITSKLSFVGYSDQTKDIDLVSQEIRVTDTRDDQSSAFKQILQPTTDMEDDSSTLHMEIHLKSSKAKNQASILFNNMKIFCVMDWVVALKDFLASNPAKPLMTEIPRVNQQVAQSLATQVSEDAQVNAELVLKLNLTDTQLVLVEDLSSPDSNALILKTTAICHYQPNNESRPLICTLQKMELFSCRLSSETSTALSIIDPFDVTIEVQTQASSPELISHKLEISLSELSVRFSYNDFLLFKRIMKSLPQQLNSAVNQEGGGSPANDMTDDMGEPLSDSSSPKSSAVNISSIEVIGEGLCVCLINDCADMDVPLLELNLRDLNFNQVLLNVPVMPEASAQVKFESLVGGSVVFRMNLDYYNRLLSGWEPMMEPWGLKASWTGNPAVNDSLDIKMNSEGVINLNMTSAILEIVQQTRDLFTRIADRDGNIVQPITSRESFVPYSLHNQTGRTLLFAVVTKKHLTTSLPTHWTEVTNGQSKPFSCLDSKSKKRHQATHESTSHRLVVVVEGWQKTTPVSIDKVGQFFRVMQTDTHNTGIKPKVVATRVVFDIVCLKNSSKCITVKSPITLSNETGYEMEARLESLVDEGAAEVLTVAADCSVPLPIAWVFSQMWFRPAGDEMITYTDTPVNCQKKMTNPGDSKSTPLLCNSVLDSLRPYRFSAVVRREYYPSDAVLETLGENTTLYQPGHTITLLPPLTVVNLLPVDLSFLIADTTYHGKLKPGKQTTFHQVDTSKSMRIDLAADGFHKGAALYVQSGSSDHMINVRVYDNSDKLLLLDARITRLALGSVKVTISVKYWMINHTGLPLVFKQVGTRHTSAGQFEENEIARSVAPLMFSYSDKEQQDLCVSMRLGNSIHPNSISGWCERFSVESGNNVRRLKVQPKDGRPEWVYNIGIETSSGSGRYHDTRMVTLVPRNKIINKSTRRIGFTQRHLARPQSNGEEIYQASLPGSSQAYHWPRHDLDALLCIKILDVPNGLWSGGFRIDRLDSIVINIRNSESGSCTLMKIETVLQGSTFTTIVADAHDIPPPMRIENYTELSLKCWQSNITHEAFKTIVKPRSSVSYAWDEPTLSSFITCSIHCDMGPSENRYNMDTIGQAEHLEYENYFYISLSQSSDSLVLDVVGGNGVVFSKREPGRRSQLWSHSVEGRLLHEGTTSSKKLYKDDSIKYCLDIAELAVITEGCSCLALRKVDSRRQTTQIWKFQEDGRLTCGFRNQCVQSLPAFGGMQPGARVALGPFEASTHAGVEAQMSMSKMLPGSGVLSVTVDTDGPTRVLRVSDIHDLENIKTMQLASDSESSMANTTQLISNKQIKLNLNLASGVSISLVNHVREELVHLSLVQPNLTLEQNSEVQTVNLTVRHIQLDNQLQGATCPIIIHTSAVKQVPKSSSKSSTRRKSSRQQALELNCQRVLGSRSTMHVFKLFTVQMSSFTLDIDELLMYKIIEMFTFNQPEVEEVELGKLQVPKDSDFDVNVRKYYFALLKVTCGEMTLSVHTVKLPQNLQEVKRRMTASFPFQFENAIIDFDPFQQLHAFESLNFVVTALSTHYKQELMSQVAKIIGAIDMFGNPLGLVNDVTTGISGLVTEGNVGSLLKNVTHGASNSLAKVTGTLSHGLGWMTMDDSHAESRDLIRRQYTGSNVLLGFKSLTHGVVGGLTSIAQQTYDGASQRGFEGMLTGLGKGLVGTVTKPVVGVLDFASGAATAIRDTSGGGGGVSHIKRRRLTRCCYGRDGLLPVYSQRSAQGQETVMFLNAERRTHERYIDHIKLSPHSDSYSLLASDHSVYIIRVDRPQEGMLLDAPLSNLLACRYVRKERPDFSIKHYLEVKVTQLSESGGSNYRTRNPQFECERAEIAEQVVLLVDHARSIYEERLHTVGPSVKASEDVI